MPEGKLGGKFSLREKIFPLRDNFPWKIAFPFPWNALFSQEMKGLGKRNFYGLRENFWHSPARENLPQAIFFASKDVWGCVPCTQKPPNGTTKIVKLLTSKNPRNPPKLEVTQKDAAFLLTVGSFLLTVELCSLQSTIVAFLLTVGAFLLTV